MLVKGDSMGTDTFDERDLAEDTPPPRKVGHQTLFELVAKDDCKNCTFCAYCKGSNENLCSIINRHEPWSDLK